MKTTTLTKADFKNGQYVGDRDLMNIEGDLVVERGLGWVRVGSLAAKGSIRIEAGAGIKTGGGIKTGWGIEAGEGIEAGGGIEAGEGIEAGLSIKCNGLLSAKLRIFAGLCNWRKPTKEEMQIVCGRLASGEVCFGELIETGMPKTVRVRASDGTIVEGVPV